MTGRLHRPIKWFLTLSVALNVFLMAGIVVHLLGFGRPPQSPLPSQIIDHIASELSAADGAVFRSAFAGEQPMLDNSVVAMRPAVARMRAALLTEPFDVASFAAAIHDLQASHAEFEQRAGVAAVRAVAALSPAGRRRLAEWHGPPPP